MLSLVLLFAVCTGTAHAQESDSSVLPESEFRYQDGHEKVIQRRKYELGHEISVAVGTLPADFFYKGLTGTLAYTLHFNDTWAWEIGSFTYSYNFPTKTRKELERIAGAQGDTEPRFAEIDWIAATHLVLKPIYGKQAVFNTNVVHLEAHLQLGGVVLHRADPANQVSFGGDIGFGFRLWLSPVTSVRLDIGEMVYVYDDNATLRVGQALHLQLGLGFNLFGGM